MTSTDNVLQCPQCGSLDVETDVVPHDFTMTCRAKARKVHARIPARECSTCGFGWVDHEGAEIQDAAAHAVTQLEDALEAQGRMYRALLDLKHRYAHNPVQYHVLAEGPLDELQKLEKTLGEISGRNTPNPVNEVMTAIAKAEAEDRPTEHLYTLLDMVEQATRST